MKKTALTTLLLMNVALGGCATMKPAEYDPGHSRAYNIARAGGLHQVKDRTIPRADYEALNAAVDATANTLSLTSSHGLGLSLGKGLAAGVLLTALKPEGNAERNSLIAWMPANEASSAKEAQQAMIAYAKSAVERTLSDFDTAYKLVYEKNGVLIHNLYNSDWGCPEWVSGQTTGSDMCNIRTQIIKPRKTPAPTFINETTDAMTYAFKSGKPSKYNSIRIRNGNASRIPQAALYERLSQHLPAWTFLYQAPGKVATESGETINFPHLLEKGNIELFVYPAE